MGVGTLYLSLLLALTATTAHSHYVAMFPSSFRPGWDYRGQITVLNTQGSNSVTVQADILDSRNNSLGTNSQPVIIQNGETAMLTISIPPTFTPTEDNRYSLKLHGMGGLKFDNTTAIELETLTSLTFVQTDKGIFKPSDLVRFRVVTVDQNLIPQKVQRTITIKNPAGSGLRKYEDDGSKAVYEKTFQLTEFPDLGQWKIEVKSEENNIEVEFPFEVDEYVLPKFEVTASVSPTYLLRGSGQTQVNIVVTAKYTYGKGVTGNLKVKTAMQTIHDNITDTRGVKEVMIDLADELKNKKMQFDSQLELTVEVTDSTQRTYSTSAVVKIATQPLLITFDKERSDNVYRSGTKPRVVVKVTDPTGKPLSDFNGDLMVTLKDNSGMPGAVNDHTLFPWTAGAMYFTKTFDTVMATTHSLTVEATLTSVNKEKYTATHYLQKFKTVGNSTLNIRVLQDDPPKMWENYALHVDAYPMDTFETIRYMVVSRGSVKREGSVDATVDVVVTPELCPEVTVIVYGLTRLTSDSKTPEIIADSTTFSMTGCQDKELTPSVPQNSLRTGSNATLNMNVAWTDKNKNAAVGKHDVFMLAVDKSIILLQGNDHDLSPSRVDQDLRKFTMGTGGSGGGGDGPIMMDARRAIWPLPYPGQTQTTTGQLLRMVGLTMLSDAAMEDVVPWEEDGVVMMEAAGAGGGDMMRRKGEQEMVPEMAEGNSAQSADVTAAKTTTVRKDFPDTWIWKTGETDDYGQMTMVEKLPDTITSWVISAFAVREDSDLVVTKNPFELAAFNPFFVDLNLPYSIRRNEIFILRCTVFNYDLEMDRMQGMVMLSPSQDFDINGGDSKPFMVKQNSGFSVEFNITARTVKTINITVTAYDKMQIYTDIVTKTLIVKPEGEARSGLETLPVLLTVNQSTFEKEVIIDYSPATPDQIVPQSKRVTVKITADMMGNVFNNIEDLVSQPTGCGEQNMITTIPNIYAMKYLVAIQDTSSEFNDTAKAYMVTGYEKETLQYRHNGTNGYSAFGKSDPSPSTWLTAFVVRSFAQANAYIPGTVDLGLLGEDVTYIQSTWSSDRNIFLELGKVIHDDMQGGSGAGDALTVYVAMCLMEAKAAGIMVNKVILESAFEKVIVTAQKVVDIANGNNEEEKKMSKNLFLAAITAYTLTLQSSADVQLVTDLIDYIKSMGAPWIEASEGEKPAAGEPMPYHGHKAGPSDIEITSYCVLAYLGTGLGGVASARDLVMWLQTKQSSLGGYSSTQDTVLALQAISQYAAVFSKAADSRVDIVLLEPPGDTITINISNNNKRILQIVQLPEETRKLKVKVSSLSSAETFSLVKVVWDYHTMPQTDKDAMKLNSTSNWIQQDLQTMKTCITMKEDIEYSNMLMVTVDSPSCWGLDDVVMVRKENPQVKRVEQDKNRIHFYLDQPETMCLTYNMAKQCEIQNAQPGSAVAYAYYKPDDLRAEVDLKMIECTEDCGPTTNTPTDHATSLSPLSGLLLTAVICLLLSLLMAS